MSIIASDSCRSVPSSAASDEIPGPLLPRVRDPRTRRWRRRLVRVGLVVVVVAFLAIAHKTLLTSYARLFRVDDPAPSDAIVVLLGGSDHRPLRALELYRERVAPLILIGLSSTDKTTAWRETHSTIEELVRGGVPRPAIQVLPRT